MESGSILMLVLGLLAIGGGGAVLAHHANSEVGVYLHRMGGIMACAFGAVLIIAAITLNGALS
jgi:hypothetical protein